MQLEIAGAEGEAGREIDRLPGKPLDALGLDGPEEVPCVSVRYQIAQKLHACTENPTEWGLHLAAVNPEIAQDRWSRQGRPDSSRSRLGGSHRSRAGGGGGGRVRPALRSSL